MRSRVPPIALLCFCASACTDGPPVTTSETTTDANPSAGTLEGGDVDGSGTGLPSDATATSSALDDTGDSNDDEPPAATTMVTGTSSASDDTGLHDTTSGDAGDTTGACVASTCAELGCGLHDDGCGTILDCSDCGDASVLRPRHVVADPTRDRFYVSVADDDPSFPGLVAVVDAPSRLIVDLVDVGDGANELGISDDHSTLWVGLDTAGSVREVDLTIEHPSPGPEHVLPFGYTNVSTTAGPIVVLPGTTTSLAVSLRDSYGFVGVAIIDDGVPRPMQAGTYHGASRLTSGPPGFLFGFYDESTLFGFYVLEVTAAGVSQTEFEGYVYGFPTDVTFANGAVYGGDGRVIDVSDPVTPTVVASLTDSGVVLPRPDVSRVHMIAWPGVTETGPILIENFDSETFVELDRLELVGFAEDTYIDFTTTDGQTLAVIGLHDGTSTLHVFSNPFPDPPVPCQPVACGAPNVCGETDDGCGTPIFCGPCGDAEALLAPRHVVADPVRDRFYVSSRGDAPVHANEIGIVDASTGVLLDGVWVGSNPEQMAISDDAGTLWVGLDGALAIRRLDLTTDPPTPGPTHSLPPVGFYDISPTYAGDLAVLPGAPLSVAVTLQRPYVLGSSGVVVLDDGVPRPVTVEFTSTDRLTGGPGATLIGLSDETPHQLTSLAITASGITETQLEAPIEYEGDDITFAGGHVYATDGRVIDVADLADVWPAGDLNFAGSMLPLLADGSVLVLSPSSFMGPTTLREVDASTLALVDEAPLVGVDAPAVRDLCTPSGARLAFVSQANDGTTQLHVMDNPFGIPTPPPPGPLLERVNHVLADPARQRYYATVNGDATAHGNEVVVLDASGAVLDSLLVGSNPGALAISDDASTLWVALEGSIEIQAVDLGVDPAVGARHRIPLWGTFDEFVVPSSMVVVPGTVSSVALALRTVLNTPSARELLVLDDGVPRNTASVFDPNPVIVTAGPGEHVLGFNGNVYDDPIHVYDLSGAGLSVESFGGLVDAPTSAAIAYRAPHLFVTSGEVLDVSDPAAPVAVDTLAAPGTVLPLPTTPEVLTLGPITITAMPKTLYRHDGVSYAIVGSANVPELANQRATDFTTIDGTTLAVIGRPSYSDVPGTLYVFDNPFVP